MIMDEEDQKSMLKKIYEENGLTLRNHSYKKCLDAIGAYKGKFGYVPFFSDPSGKTAAPGLDRANHKDTYDFVIKKISGTPAQELFPRFRRPDVLHSGDFLSVRRRARKMAETFRIHPGGRVSGRVQTGILVRHNTFGAEQKPVRRRRPGSDDIHLARRGHTLVSRQ